MHRLIRGAAWSVLGTIGARALNLIAMILAARLLGQEGYGELGVLQSTIVMFGVLSGFSMGLTASRHVAQYREIDPERAGRILRLSTSTACAISGAMAISLFCLAPWLAETQLHDPHLAGGLRMGSIVLFCSGLLGAQTGALSGFEGFRAIAQINFVTGVVSFPLVIIGGLAWGVFGTMCGLAVSSALSCLLAHWALAREIKRFGIPAGRTAWDEWPVLLNYGLPAVAIGIVGAVPEWACPVLLADTPDGYAQLGVWNAIRDWFLILGFLPNLLGQVFLPIMSERKNEGDSRRLLRLSFAINAFAVIPLAAMGALASPYLLSLYGPEFSRESGALVITFVAAAAAVMSKPAEFALHSRGKAWRLLFATILFSTVYYVLSLQLVHRGATGISLARCMAFVVYCICLNVYLALGCTNCRSVPPVT